MQISPQTSDANGEQRDDALPPGTEPFAGDPTNKRAMRQLAIGISAGLLLGSATIGSSSMRIAAVAPEKPALDLSLSDFADCDSTAPACRPHSLLGDSSNVPHAWLQFAGDLSPIHDAMLVRVASLSSGSDGGNAVVPASTNVDDVLGRGAGSGSASAAGATPASDGGALPQLLAIASLPSVPSIQGGAPSAGGPQLPSKAPSDDDAPNVAVAPDDAPTPKKKPRSLVPTFTPDMEPLVPIIARIAPPDTAPSPGNPPPPGIAPFEEIITVTPGVSTPANPNTGPDNPDVTTVTALLPQVVPEPSALALLGLGLVCFFGRLRKAPNSKRRSTDIG